MIKKVLCILFLILSLNIFSKYCNKNNNFGRRNKQEQSPYFLKVRNSPLQRLMKKFLYKNKDMNRVSQFV